jgi:hypothetical protein
MGNRNLAMVSGQARGHCRRCIALNDDTLRPLIVHYLTQSSKHSRDQVIERLIRAHDTQIYFRSDSADFQDLIQKTAMLGSDADPHGISALSTQFADQWK